MFPEYDEFMEYIHLSDVREAFEYLVKMTRELADYRCAPRPHGYIKRNLWYYKNEDGLFAFTVNRKHLLFYFRSPLRAHPGLNLDALRLEFPDAEEKTTASTRCIFAAWTTQSAS